jgi:DNA-binding response OmpR family regulator
MEIFGSILIIDDEASLRSTLTRIMQNAGCKATSAADGSEALRLLALNAYDLVFLDLRLPDMHGLDILREIRRQYPRLPVVVLTAHGTMNSAMEALHLDATDYLLKPVDPEALIERTRRILQAQLTEKRRQEILNKITLLQAELTGLENPSKGELLLHQESGRDSRHLIIGSLALDLHSRRVLSAGKTIPIPPTSFDYLGVLVRHAPNVVRFQTLVVEAQGYHAEFNEARELAKWHIHVLRQALEQEPKKPRLILNVRGIGYQLVPD